MSASNEWFDSHLTPRGWEDGSRKEDFGGTKRVDPPGDRVLTIHVEEHLGSAHGKWHRSREETFRGKDALLVAQLLDRYGPGPYPDFT
jgi:hypothetical protein